MRTKSFFMPSLFTFLNFFWGFFAITEILRGDLPNAAWFILIAVLCDGMDGKLARWTHSETTFGFELDSLADLISFGLAPALLVYVGVLSRYSLFGFSVCFLYVFAGGYRLARFNTIQKGDRSSGYIGLPIPVAGIAIAALWIFKWPFQVILPVEVWIVFMFFLIFMMMSTIAYDWPKISFIEGWYIALQSVSILLCVLFMAIFPHRILFPVLLFYILLGMKNWVVSLIRGEVTFVELIMPLQKNKND
ncbi:CDP-diacylglycerol--serine O-phosphatidyltransferase [bacterium]|nr:CDP-diacylglycerol--serine O-phosphatidyltransferase [bacterium]RQV96003.1 MAG: CDP-diacylglycerol--serine O-phosphatidyltransferase [bacterium]